MRLIDADALIKRMKAHTVEERGLDDWYKAGLTDSIRTAVDLTENAPTIDPIKHGQYIEARSGGMLVYPDGQRMCSVCNQRMPCNWVKYPPYCYGCGARMDGERND